MIQQGGSRDQACQRTNQISRMALGLGRADCHGPEGAPSTRFDLFVANSARDEAKPSESALACSQASAPRTA